MKTLKPLLVLLVVFFVGKSLLKKKTTQTTEQIEVEEETPLPQAPTTPNTTATQPINTDGTLDWGGIFGVAENIFTTIF